MEGWREGGRWARTITKEQVAYKNCRLSSSFQNGLGPQAVLVLATDPLNPISTYGHTTFSSYILGSINTDMHG